MQKFFDVINKNLFNVFSRKNQNLYAECLLRMYEASLNYPDLHLPKKDAYAILCQVFEQFQEEDEIYDETIDDNERAMPDRASVLRYVRDCGWIKMDRNDAINDDIIIFTPVAGYMLQAMRKSVSPSILSTGEHWKSIQNSLRNILYSSDPRSALLHAHEESRNLVAEFANIDNLIRGLYDELRDSRNPEEILQNIYTMGVEVTEGRINKIMSESLNPLNVEEISVMLEDIRYSNQIREKIISSLEVMNNLSKEEADEKIDVLLDDIYRDVCENSEKKRMALESVNNQYWTLAVRYVRKTFSGGTDISSIVNKIIAGLKEGRDDELKRFLAVSAPALDYQGPFRIRNYSGGAPEALPEEETIPTIVLRTKYSKKQLEDNMLRILGDKKTMSSSEIRAEESDFKMFAGMLGRGFGGNAPYVVEETGRQIQETDETGIYTYPEMIVRKK